MGLKGDGLLCWNKLEDKLAFKLSQLTRLLHHFSAYPPEAESSLANPEEVAAQHESEIHDILNETALRIKLFKSSLQVQAQDTRIQEAIEAMKTEHEAVQHVTRCELKKAELIAKDLEDTLKDSEVIQESLTTKVESLVREMKVLKCELEAKTCDLEKARLASEQHCQEMKELKRCHQEEMEHEKDQLEKVHQDLLVVAQSQLQTLETESQECLKDQLAIHSQAMEEMKSGHVAEMEQLKMDAFMELHKLSHDLTSREANWQDEKLDLQQQIDVAVQEKLESSLTAQKEIEEGVRLLRSIEDALAKEKEITSKLQKDLYLATEDIQILKENIKTTSISNDNLVIALGKLEQDAFESQIAHNSVIAKWESVAVQLREDLENMTNTCSANENDIKSYKLKLDEMAFQLITTRKELSLGKFDLEESQMERQKLTHEIECQKEDMQRIERDAEAKAQTLTAEISRLQLECIAQKDSSAQKMKELLDIRIQQQLAVHESDKEILQRTFIAQLEEDRKEKKLQLEALQNRQREEKAQAKGVYEKYSRTLQGVEEKLEEQEKKSLSKLLDYNTKVITWMKRLDSLEISGSNLEEEFGSLSKQLLKHSELSKQVGSAQQKILKETEEKCHSLENAMVNMTKEHTASMEQHEEIVKHLNQAIVVKERAHSDAVTIASKSYTMKIQQCMDDMQRSKDEHNLATKILLQAHEMELAKLRSTIESQKDAEVVEERTRLQNRLQRDKLELNEEMELIRLEFGKELQEQKDTLDVVTKKYDKLLRSHLGIIKDQREAADVELKRSEQVHAQALTSCTEKWNRELDKMEENHTTQLEKLEHVHAQEMQDIHATFRQKLSAAEEGWKQKLEVVEKQWKCRLEGDQTLWRIEQDNEIEELRKSLLFAATEERNCMVQDHKIMTNKLENIISSLKMSVNEKDDRVCRLLQDMSRMDETHKMLVLDLQTKHKADLCEMLERQRIELTEVQKEGAALVEELQEKQKVELASSCMEMEKVKVQMMEKQTDLEKKLEKLQERFVNRESRVEDVALISKLELTCKQKDDTITKLNGRTNQLQLELYNREENYNKIFGNSAPLILQQGISDWLRPKPKVENLKFTSEQKWDRNYKGDMAKVAMMQKRSTSASRSRPKDADNNGRSASTLS
ncbi:unnamed protein product [Calypogeia fissa]